MAVSTVPIPTIDAAGFHLPSFADQLAAHKADYRGIYGQDTYLESDSQDGQWVAIEATAINDCCTLALAVYNSFSPSTAQGAGLSSVVKVNGIKRASASFSTATVTVVGVAGTVLTACQARDEGGYIWTIPTVTIPLSGQVDVTATCMTLGAVTAAAGTIDQIANPTRGWQTVTNAAAATPGNPVETDPELRVRQSQSTALPSLSLLEGMTGAIANLPNVARFRPYENDTVVTDANGLPGHSISLVVDGGDAAAIAAVIAKKKGAAGTYGSAVQTVTDAAGVPHDIRFFRPTIPDVAFTITLKAFTGYSAAIAARIQQAVSDWTNALGIGNPVRLTRAYVPANLGGGAGSETFEIVSVAAGRDGGAVAATDVPIAFNEAPLCHPSDVTIVIAS